MMRINHIYNPDDHRRGPLRLTIPTTWSGPLGFPHVLVVDATRLKRTVCVRKKEDTHAAVYNPDPLHAKGNHEH